MSTNNVTLGSGYIYVMELPAGGTVPADSALEVAANQFGYTKGGATLSYETDYQEINDDNGQIKENILSSDKCTFKCGAFMGSAADIVKICPTATSTTASGVTTVKLGGVANDNNKKYVVRFKHKTEPLRVTIIGKNTDGFELTFSADDAVTLEPTFTCSAMDATGVLAEIKTGTNA
jgi:hypothetical protein